MKIVVDAFGGDNAPVEIIEGAKIALEKHKNLELILCGDSKKIEALMGEEYKNRVEIVHAPEVILNTDVPTEAIRHKKESSLVKAYDVLKERDDVIGLVSAGSTGAVLAGAIMKIGRIKGISRPALAPILPTKKDSDVIIIDSGANVDCKPEYLLQFGHMGSVFMSGMFDIKDPKIALLSVGTEDKKGSEFSKEVFNLLKQEKSLNFLGNMEARDILSGQYDVVVADGFSGNIALKGIEGGINFALHNLKYAVETGSLFSKIGYLFLRKSINKVKSKVDYRNFGGAPFLGINKIVVKSHGSSTAKTIYASILQVKRMHEFDMIRKLSDIFGD